ncbi:hypothetical protein K402DRAFT_425929 [Aulographum hederae CBS 113979]|uniref:Uncharacterized protein n=1 Tax=Aulographum hederae CBS 113979 TaxID=1176131 RepID=A0A6G1GJB7_9PEZI|nr:hypothetical protein K402DRAFT_425929 [Aulographum hederae CBS 113979]
MRLSTFYLAVVLLCVAPAYAQDAINSLASEIGSMLPAITSAAVQFYTQVTAALATPTATPSSSTLSSSSVSSSRTTTASSPAFSASTTSRSSTTASLSSSFSSTISSPSSAAENSRPTRHDKDTAIIIGSVLGAALLALVATLIYFLCCRRRRKIRHSTSPSEESLNAWRGSNRNTTGSVGNLLDPRATSGPDNPMAAAARGPEMSHAPSEHPRGNPFTLIPPPPRRTAPNSRPGLTDDYVPYEDQSAHRTPMGIHHGLSNRGDHHGGEALAAGTAGAALGGAAAHHHNTHANQRHELPASEARHSILRKPVPSGGSADYAPVPAGEDYETAGPSDAYHHGQEQTARSPFLDDAAIESPRNSHEQSGHHRSLSGEPLMTAGAGALVGTAAAHHHSRPMDDRAHHRHVHELPGHEAKDFAKRDYDGPVSPLSPSQSPVGTWTPYHDDTPRHSNDIPNIAPPPETPLPHLPGSHINNPPTGFGASQPRDIDPRAQNRYHAVPPRTSPPVPNRSPKRASFGNGNSTPSPRVSYDQSRTRFPDLSNPNPNPTTGPSATASSSQSPHRPHQHHRRTSSNISGPITGQNNWAPPDEWASRLSSENLYGGPGSGAAGARYSPVSSPSPSPPKNEPHQRGSGSTYSNRRVSDSSNTSLVPQQRYYSSASLPFQLGQGEAQSQQSNSQPSTQQSHSHPHPQQSQPRAAGFVNGHRRKSSEASVEGGPGVQNFQEFARKERRVSLSELVEEERRMEAERRRRRRAAEGRDGIGWAM